MTAVINNPTRNCFPTDDRLACTGPIPGNMRRSYGERPLHSVPAVMFRDEIEVRLVDPPSSEELKDRWYSGTEYFFIKKEALSTVRRMATTKIQDGDDDSSVCTRGLDFIEDEAVRRRNLTIDRVVQTVLEMQKRQGSSPDNLADVYREVTSDSVQKSIENGQADARDAQLYLADLRNPKNKKKLHHKSSSYLTRRLVQKIFAKKSSSLEGSQ